jgi:acetoin utilization deacetylase AcuC-like enzyme
VSPPGIEVGEGTATELALLTNPASSGHRAAGHPERPERIEAIVAALSEDGDLAGMPRANGGRVGHTLLEAIHHPEYVEAILRIGAELEAAGRTEWLDGDTYMAPGSLEAALTSAGAAVDATRAVLHGESARAFSLCRPPGHHATRDRGMGFCLFNNVALAAQAALETGLQRVAIIDFDVHHGNGTQDIFYERNDVLYMSSHEWPLYPGTGRADERGRGEGEGFTLNVPMDAGGGEAEYLAVFDERFAPALREYQPELLLVSAGFDAHLADPLAGMELTTQSYGVLAARIRAWSNELCGGRSIWTLEGGYDLDALAGSVVEVVKELR